MSMMKIFMNLATFMRLGRLVVSLVNNALQKESKLPNTKDIRDLLEIVRTLLEKGAIDFPNLDEMQIAQGIKQLEDQLVVSLEQAEINIAKFGDLNPRFGSAKAEESKA